MHENELRELIEEVRSGTLPRRSFIQQLVALGLSAPMASMLLMHAGVASAQPAQTYRPTKRGGGGVLKVLWWQGATLLQPHFANGTKDQEGSRIFYESLAVWDGEGNLIPILAAEVPTRENGGLSADGRSVTWKLKKDVTWHDGQPFTADDCVFTWEYAKDPATAAVTTGVYKDVTVTKVDPLTVRVTFPKPTPFWATAFVAAEGMIIPKHVFGPYIGAKSRDAPANLKPVGTGPYKFVDFKPGDMVRGEINTNYHMPNRPFFDAIEMKGGGDATSAARAVLQTGEFDYAWNLQVEDEVLKRLEAGGKGRALIVQSGDIEFIQLNTKDPWNEVDGERANVKSKHFAFSDPAVREAMSLLADRKGIQEFIYGRTGVATSNFLNNPARFRSPNTKYEFNVDKANQVLDAAGWKKGADGVREKDGKKLKFVYQTSVNSLRQKEQAVVKQACQKAGIDLELKSVTASVFFSSDVANPGHLRQVLVRHADVHDHDDAAGSRALHGPVPVARGVVEGEQVARSQHHSLGQRRLRQDVSGRGGRTRSGQARRAVHTPQRSSGEGQRHHSADQPAAGARIEPQARDAAHRLGPRLLAAAELVSGDRRRLTV